MDRDAGVPAVRPVPARPAWESTRLWAPDLVAAGLVATVGLVEAAARSLGLPGAVCVLVAATAVALARHLPAYALAVIWASGAVQVLSGLDVIAVPVLAAMVVAYGVARHGTRGQRWLSALSILAAATFAMAWLVLRGSAVAYEITGRSGALSYAGSATALLVTGWLLVVGLLGVPWVTGLAVRARSQADRSRVHQLAAEAQRDRAEVDRAAAEQVALVRAEQTRLARDVHDVVGHSLAVILVQAESAGFLPDDDLDRIRLTMGNIATSARRSLQDVRAVLSSTGDAAATGITAPTVDELVADLREAGNDVRSETVGEPWPLTPAQRTLRLPPRAGDAHQRPQARPAPHPGVRRAALARRPAARGPQPHRPGRAAPRGWARGARDATSGGGGRRPPRDPSPGRRHGTGLHGHGVDPDRRDRRMSEPIRVVLVDDQDLFRAGVAVIVDAQPDMTVVGTGGSGRDAVRLVDEVEPDVVLLDMRMPDGDGVDATRQIFAPDRAARRTRPVRVLVLTTFDLDDRAATAIRYGASGFLLKDTTPAMLTDAIRTVFVGNAVLAPADLTTLLDGRFQPRPSVPAAFRALTDKEREVFDAVARGRTNAEIAGGAHLVGVDGQDPCRRGPAQAGPARPGADRGVRPRPRPGRGLTTAGRHREAAADRGSPVDRRT